MNRAMIKVKKFRFKDLKIRHKFNLLFIGFVIIPLMLTILIINLQAGKLIIQKSKEDIFNNLKYTENTLSGIMKETEFLSRTILSHDEIQDMVKFYRDKSYLDVEKSKIDFNISMCIW